MRRAPTRVVSLDLSKELKTAYALTGPSVLANFVRIKAGESLPTTYAATSEFFYVSKGSGHTETEKGTINWNEGDIFALPGMAATHHADTDSSFYMVNDSPLLAYLGVQKAKSLFAPHPLSPRDHCGRAGEGEERPERRQAQPREHPPREQEFRPDHDHL